MTQEHLQATRRKSAAANNSSMDASNDLQPSCMRSFFMTEIPCRHTARQCKIRKRYNRCRKNVCTNTDIHVTYMHPSSEPDTQAIVCITANFSFQSHKLYRWMIGRLQRIDPSNPPHTFMIPLAGRVALASRELIAQHRDASLCQLPNKLHSLCISWCTLASQGVLQTHFLPFLHSQQVIRQHLNSLHRT